MKFCPVVPEICRGQVHVTKKERRKRIGIRIRIRIRIIITRYDYNLTIMKSPKPATENRLTFFIKSYLWNRTMLNLCGIVSAILEIVRCQESFRDIIIYPHMKWRWNRTMLNLCGIVVAILKMVTGRNFDDIGQYWIFTANFLCRVLAAILKMADTLKILKTQNCSSNGELSLCQMLCLYHYPVRSYQH